VNVIDPRLPPVHGRVDAQGRLIEADMRLNDLNMRAGGTIGSPLAVPQLASLARLAKRLGILVSRSVIAADGQDDVELWVKAEPDPADGSVSLQITGWRKRLPWIPPTDDADRDLDFVRTAASWVWETDAALRLTHISVGAGARHGFDATALLGQPLTKLFALGEDDEGNFPILDALAMRERFDNQPAQIRATGRPVRLSATPRNDAAGGFTGFFGATVAVEPGEARTQLVPDGDATGITEAFASRLDRALRAPLGRIIANADSINAQSEGPLR